MHIVIVAVGSRGDIQPCIALGAALARVGCTVRLVAPAPFATFVTGHGLDFAGLPVDPSGMLNGDVGREWVESGRDPVAFIRGLGDLAGTLGEPLADAVLDGCAGADVIAYTTLAFPAWHVAQARGVPRTQIGFAPLSPTAAFPPALLPDLFGANAARGRPATGALARAYHRAGHWLFAQMLWVPLRRRTNAWRTSRLGTPALGWRSPALRVDDAGEPLLAAFSPTVVPPPPDWGPHVTTTGYWFLDAPRGARLPDAVEAFLASGPAPVSVGMGSMTGRDPARVTEIVVEALRRTGQRGLLLSGWAGLGAAVRESAQGDVEVLVADELPHDLLFPRVRAVVHHGGAGTTGAGLRAGAPTVVIPHFGDQPLWGDRVHAIGAGPPPIARRHLTARRLAHAISATVHDRRIREGAAAVGRAIAGERGLAIAVDAITRLAPAVTGGPGRPGR
jgi:UDP:flavonoid glycosyltransferase YjiC (YdhE family)